MTAARRPEFAKSRPGSRPGETIRVLISRSRVRQRVRQLARELGGEVSFDFLSVSSYGKGTSSTGVVKLIKDLDVSIEGRTVIVVEDILDSGLTLKYLLRLFEGRKPKHMRVVVLLDKAERRIANVHADYTGFTIPNEFVVGYGLDYDERYRNLADVCILQLTRSSAKR